VKLEVVALDFDGTIAEHGVLHPAIPAAIARLREREIMVVLVTGRILDDLRAVAGDLRFVDAVVAENGAVLAFPTSGHTQVLGAAPSPTFLAELRRRGVPAKHGMVVVEADVEFASTIQAVIREQHLALALIFNRDRVMVLPEANDKATGLRELLRLLQRSEHHAIGVGDAENDHALLATCAIGAAVAWGSPALKAMADVIIEGTGPEAVAAFMERLAADPAIPDLTSHHHASGASSSLA
jgi:hydroxymethylpyrimidine pyrophosphatase-like HAD family hydrolase